MLNLPTPLHDNGPRIMVMRTGVVPASKYPIELMSRLSSAMQEITLLEDDYANINGVVFIMDSAGATAAHWLQWTPSLMKKMTVYSEEAIPLRPKANHFVNTIVGFEPIFNMVKPMLSKKQQERVSVMASYWHQFSITAAPFCLVSSSSCMAPKWSCCTNRYPKSICPRNMAVKMAALPILLPNGSRSLSSIANTSRRRPTMAPTRNCVPASQLILKIFSAWRVRLENSMWTKFRWA